MIGKTLSHYKVIEKIGQGGMGEVYRAEDTNLSREVAIKVLPEQFTQDPQRLARFEREAKLLASLNHPNIAAIYGFEHSDSMHFLVLELVPGDTLAERVAKGPMPVEEALEICLQIAEGVEAAHEKGVIHRDLKPANVKVTPEGKVKVLDFGLAKAFEAETPVTDISQSPTLTEEMTRAGVILGTAAYMSPEQAKGKPVDKRADIFAFGAVLYELLTGKRAFQGETITETLASILKSEPDWEALPQETPRNIGTLLHHCLQKDPDDRFHDEADVRIVLQAVMNDPVEVLQSTTISPRAQPVQWVFVLAFSLVAFLAGAVFWPLWDADSGLGRNTERLEINLGPDLYIPIQLPGTATGRQGDSFALSHDGQSVVYVATGPNLDSTQLYLRRLDEFEVKLLPGTENATDPFFSLDDQWLGFLSGDEVKKVLLAGGRPVSVCKVPGSVWGSLSWGKDVIVFGVVSSGIWQVPVTGGEARPLISLDFEKRETRQGDVHFLPDGETLLFTTLTSPFEMPQSSEAYRGTVGNPQIEVLSLGTGNRRKLTDGQRPRYAASGHIVLQRGGSLFAFAFDPGELQASDSPVPVQQQVRRQLLTGLADFAISDTGSLLFLPSIADSEGDRLVWVDRQGNTESVTEMLRWYDSPRISPDGKRLAVTIQGQTWLYEFDRDILTPLTFEFLNASAIWTLDGQRLILASNRPGFMNLFEVLADGTGEPQQLTDSRDTTTPSSLSIDGVLAYTEGPLANRDIWMLPLEGDGKPHPFIVTQSSEYYPQFSPDGRWVAFNSNRSGQTEVWIKPYPDGGMVQISTDGGVEPMWSNDGKELFYRSGNNLMVVRIQTEPTLRAERPKLVVEGFIPATVDSRGTTYDLADNAERILLIQPEQQPTSTRLHVVLNWFEELKRLVPTN